MDRLEVAFSHSEIELVDESITKMLQTATKKVEGMKCGIPYSEEKEKRRCRVLYYKMMIREFEQKIVDQDLKIARRYRAVIVNEPQTLAEAEEGLAIAKELWKEIIERGAEYREKELLDYHQAEITEEGEKLVKKKKKIMAGIRKKLQRDHVFHYLSRHVGKGLRDTIRRLHVQNEHKEVIETLIKREDVENRLIEFNANHFKKALNSIAHKDKICNKLRRSSIRDKILNGTLDREECDDYRVCRFLCLLKRPSDKAYSQQRREITFQDWIKVVKKSKKRSASSIFSKRTRAVYKCAAGSDRMTMIFVRFYNFFPKTPHVESLVVLKKK